MHLYGCGQIDQTCEQRERQTFCSSHHGASLERLVDQPCGPILLRQCTPSPVFHPETLPKPQSHGAERQSRNCQPVPQNSRANTLHTACCFVLSGILSILLVAINELSTPVHWRFG